jgi:hypothetical protein
MKWFLLIFIIILNSCATGKQRRTESFANDSIDAEVKEVFVPVVIPDDSAIIRAQLKCNEKGEILLSMIETLSSEKATLLFSVDSLGRLKADFHAKHDSIKVKKRTEKRIVTRTIHEKEYVERKKSKWDIFCIGITITVMALILFFIGTKIYKIWQR